VDRCKGHWRRQSSQFLAKPYMPRHFFKQYLPTSDKLSKYRALRPLGKLLQNEQIWHLHRRSVAGAAFIGLFVAWLPIPMQMLVAGAGAIVFRCNLPLSVALVWVTNPVTMPAMFWSSYKLGAWLMDKHLIVSSSGFTFEWITNELHQIWQPLLLGSIIFGLISGTLALLAIRLIWRLHVVQAWHARKERRRQAREAFARLLAEEEASGEQANAERDD
jgi:uncharacterized protein